MALKKKTVSIEGKYVGCKRSLTANLFAKIKRFKKVLS